MLIATIARPPRFGGKVKSFDASDAEKIAGVVKVLQVPQGVAIVATSTWAALKAQRAVKVEWDESAVFKRDGAFQCGAETKSETAFHLSFDNIWIDGDAAIDSTDDAFDLDRAVVFQPDVGNISDVRRKALVDRNTPQHASRRRRRPSGLFRNELQHARMTRVLLQHSEAELDGVFARFLGEDVDHVLGCVRSVRCADRSPPEHRHADGLGMQLDLKIGNSVGQRRRAFHRGRVDAVLDHPLRKWSSGDDRLADDAMLPSDDVAILVEASLNPMNVDWAVITTLHVIFARPKHLDRH
jgi:hypothetical protein